MSDSPQLPAEEDDRPWEQPGAVRRDCAPHRAPLFRLLKTANGLAVVAILLCAPLTLVTLGVGLTTWILARRDLRAMQAGRMDPAGKAATDRALKRAHFTTFFALFWLPVAVALTLYLASEWKPPHV